MLSHKNNLNKKINLLLCSTFGLGLLACSTSGESNDYEYTDLDFAQASGNVCPSIVGGILSSNQSALDQVVSISGVQFNLVGKSQDVSQNPELPCLPQNPLGAGMIEYTEHLAYNRNAPLDEGTRFFTGFGASWEEASYYVRESNGPIRAQLDLLGIGNEGATGLQGDQQVDSKIAIATAKIELEFTCSHEQELNIPEDQIVQIGQNIFDPIFEGSTMTSDYPLAFSHRTAMTRYYWSVDHNFQIQAPGTGASDSSACQTAKGNVEQEANKQNSLYLNNLAGECTSRGGTVEIQHAIVKVKETCGNGGQAI